MLQQTQASHQHRSAGRSARPERRRALFRWRANRYRNARCACPATPVFEYVGATALTVVSPITRKTYRFDKPGARIEVDLRDRSWIAFVPSLVPAK